MVQHSNVRKPGKLTFQVKDLSLRSTQSIADYMNKMVTILQNINIQEGLACFASKLFLKEKNTEDSTFQLATRPAVQEIPMSLLRGIQELTSMLFLFLLYEHVQPLNLQLLRELAFVPGNVLVKVLVNNSTRI